MRLLCLIIVYVSDVIDLCDVSDDEKHNISVQVEHVEEGKMKFLK
jgi:hypothetical protein